MCEYYHYKVFKVFRFYMKNYDLLIIRKKSYQVCMNCTTIKKLKIYYVKKDNTKNNMSKQVCKTIVGV